MITNVQSLMDFAIIFKNFMRTMYEDPGFYGKCHLARAYILIAYTDGMQYSSFSSAHVLMIGAKIATKTLRSSAKYLR